MNFRFFLLLAFVGGCQSPPAPKSQATGSVARVLHTGAGQQRCGHPPTTSVKKARVVVRVMVLADGTPQHVEVTKSTVTGEGFEEAAANCAMKYRYQPAEDGSGAPRRDWTREFNVDFSRFKIAP